MSAQPPSQAFPPEQVPTLEEGYGTAIPVPPGEPAKPAQESASAKNKVGLVALILSAVGFLFGVIPGALIVGWILLPIAFILGIVALFQPGKKTTGIIAIIISAVGTVASIMVFVVGVGNAMEDAFGGGEVTVQTEDSSATLSPQSTQATAEKPDKAGSEVGTRDNPAPLGSTIAGTDWEVVINSVDADGTQEVLAANQFNDEPTAGQQYLLVNLTVTYVGEGSASDSHVSVAFVSSDGRVFNPFDAFVVAPEPMFGGNELYSGGSSTGNEVISVPEGADGLLRISPGIFADEIFVKMS